MAKCLCVRKGQKILVRPELSVKAGRRKEVKVMQKVIQAVRGFWEEEDAVGVVEIILILVVLISLVLIFKSQLTSLVSSTLSRIQNSANSV